MSMHTASPQAALEAVTWRRLLISSWPWRSAGYVLVTLPAAAALAIPAVPWLMLAAGGYQVGVVALLVLPGGVLIAALGLKPRGEGWACARPAWTGGQRREARISLAMACSPDALGCIGTASEAGMSPSIHLTPGGWQASCPM